MAKKKGKKKGKSEAKLLASMTEEERILYLEQKALAEAEMRKKKEEMLMLFLKVSYHFRVNVKKKKLLIACQSLVKSFFALSNSFKNTTVVTGCSYDGSLFQNRRASSNI